MRKIPLFLIALALAGCGKKSSPDADMILDVRKVLNKTPEQVVAALGKPDSSYTITIANRKIPAQMYFDHRIEIQYLKKDAATDIVVYQADGLPFEPAALEKFNIKIKKAPQDFREGVLMRWYNVEGIGAVAMYDPRRDSLGNLKSYTIFFTSREK